MPAHKQDLETRFSRNYIPIPETGCWLWIGNGNKYGKMKVQGKFVSAHRISYSLYRGEIPKDKLVLHFCDVVGCVNPNHLYLGNHSQNQKDRFNRSKRGTQRDDLGRFCGG